MQLQEAMAEFELYFPSICCTLNAHLLIHLPAQILRCGPVPFFWMYPLEREVGRLVDSVTSFKVAEESMVKNHSLSEAVELARSRYEDASCSALRHRHLQGADPSMTPLYLQSEIVISLSGKAEEVLLSPEEKAHLLVLWKRHCPCVRQVYARYEADLAARRFQGPIRGWQPRDGGPALTPEQQAARFCPWGLAASFRRGHRNGTYLRGFEKRFKSYNSGFKVDDSSGSRYGVVKRFILHRAFPHPSSPRLTFVQVSDWRVPISHDLQSELPRAKSVAATVDFPRFCRFSDCFPMSVSFLPADDPHTWFVFEFCI
jgi:hypothetical protein